MYDGKRFDIEVARKVVDGGFDLMTGCYVKHRYDDDGEVIEKVPCGGCYMTAQAIGMGLGEQLNRTGWTGEEIQRALIMNGFNSWYQGGVIHGFDGAAFCYDNHSAYAAGYEDGQAARELLGEQM